jgi:hypothetical protein
MASSKPIDRAVPDGVPKVFLVEIEHPLRLVFLDTVFALTSK